MSYIANWTTFNINVLPANQSSLVLQSQSILMYLKAQLLGIGWTVLSSSNSGTVASGGTSAQNDLWTSNSALIWGYNSTNLRSWIVFASPVGFVAGPDGTYLGAQSQMYFGIDLVGDGGNDNYYNFQYNLYYYSSLPTGGTITSLPTGGNQQTLNINSPFVHLLYPNPSSNISASMKMNFCAMANGGWYFCLAAAGSGAMPMIMYYLPLVNVYQYNSKPYPYAAICGQYFNWSGSNFSFWNCFDQGYNSFVKGWNYDGTPGSPRCLCLSTANNVIPGSGSTVQGDINDNIFLLPGYIYNNVSGNAGMVGQLPDFYMWGPVSIANGCIYPISSPAYCNITNLWLPTPTAFQL